MTQEIKPCPFCGSSKCQEIYQHGFAEGWVVRCNSCGANGAAFAYDQDAVEKWNDVSSVSVWRPIDTAPKDGTKILANTYKGAAVILWDSEEACWCFVSQAIPCYAFLKSTAPTHWMPLPSPPSP